MLVENRSGWQNPRILTTLLLVFLSGAVAGALTMRVGLHRIMHGGSPGPAWEEGGKWVPLSRLKTELQLSPDQATKIARVLDDYAMYYQTVKEQLYEVRATGKTRVLDVLDEQQKQKFEKMCGDLAQGR